MKKLAKVIGAIFIVIILSSGVLYFYFPGVIVKSMFSAARSSAGLIRQEIQVDDHMWVYLEGGKGDTIVFLHGFGPVSYTHLRAHET